METTIKVKRETMMRVNKKKYDLGAKNHDETINRILDIVEKIEGGKE